MSPLYCTFYEFAAPSGPCSLLWFRQRAYLLPNVQDYLRTKTFIFCKISFMKSQNSFLDRCFSSFSFKMTFNTEMSTFFATKKAPRLFQNPVSSSHHRPSVVILSFFHTLEKVYSRVGSLDPPLEGIMRSRNSLSCCFCSGWAPSRVPHVSKCTIWHKQATEYRLRPADQTCS